MACGDRLELVSSQVSFNLRVVWTQNTSRWKSLVLKLNMAASDEVDVESNTHSESSKAKPAKTKRKIREMVKLGNTMKEERYWCAKAAESPLNHDDGDLLPETYLHLVKVSISRSGILHICNLWILLRKIVIYRVGRKFYLCGPFLLLKSTAVTSQ